MNSKTLVLLLMYAISVIGCQGQPQSAANSGAPPASPASPPPADRAEWMTRGSFGLMVHWLAPGPMPEKGSHVTDLDRAVDAFNLERFLVDFDQTGADWLIFTIGQNTEYYAGPNRTLDALAGPGHCSRRDLVGEIAKALHQRGKRFIAYLPSEVNAPKGLHKPFAWDPKDQSEFQRRYTRFIREYSMRLGTNLDGWWFDGCYTWDVFPNRTYNWPLWFEAARAGNSNAIVAFNDGSFCIGITQPVTPLQDYLSGEVEVLREGKIRLGRDANSPLYLPKSRFADGTRTQWHALVPIDCGDQWGWYGTPGPMPPPRYADEELLSFLRNCKAVRGAVTFNVGIYQEGHLAKATLEQLTRVSKKLAPTLQSAPGSPTQANHQSYLGELVAALGQHWPTNRTITIVCHGHSVPAGYFKTPVVDTFNAYPHLLHRALKERFPCAVVNVIVTAIGGEDSASGARRFERDVLALRPDLVTIDYSLNDRRLGLAGAETAWRSMITNATARGVKVLLLTPTPDLSAKLDDPNEPLVQHAEQVRRLAAEKGVGLVDSLSAFQRAVAGGRPLAELMSQVNHPNRPGHDLVVAELLRWFPAPLKD